MKLFCDNAAGSWPRTWIAVAEASSIVGANARESRDFGLHFVPGEIAVAKTRVENYRRAALAGAVDVHLAPLDINQFARHRVKTAVPCLRDVLIEKSGGG